jgi:hypothetical protein
LDHPILSIVSLTHQIYKCNNFEYLIGLEATQHPVVFTTLPNLVDIITVLNPKKRGSVKFKVTSPSKPKLLKT